MSPELSENVKPLQVSAGLEEKMQGMCMLITPSEVCTLLLDGIAKAGPTSPELQSGNFNAAVWHGLLVWAGDQSFPPRVQSVFIRRYILVVWQRLCLPEISLKN